MQDEGKALVAEIFTTTLINKMYKHMTWQKYQKMCILVS